MNFRMKSLVWWSPLRGWSWKLRFRLGRGWMRSRRIGMKSLTWWSPLCGWSRKLAFSVGIKSTYRRGDFIRALRGLHLHSRFIPPQVDLIALASKCLIPTRKYILRLRSFGCVFVWFYIRFWAVFRQFRQFNLQSGVKMWCRREDNFGHHILPTGQ